MSQVSPFALGCENSAAWFTDSVSLQWLLHSLQNVFLNKSLVTFYVAKIKTFFRLFKQFEAV